MRTSLDLGFVLRSAALALPVTMVSSGARLLLVPAYVPTVPIAVAAPAALALLVTGALAGSLWRREAAWLCCFALPVLLAGVDLQGELEPVELQLRLLGAGWAWAATFDALATWLWLGGPRRPGVSFALFATATGLEAQLVGFGMQLVLPGILLSLLLALLGIAATRHREGWLAETFRGIPRAPAAWAVAAIAPLAAWIVGVGVLLALTRDPEMLARQLVDPLAAPLWTRVGAEIASFATWGALLAVAGALYDAAVARTED